MANLSQQKRQRMIEFIDKIREEHKEIWFGLGRT